MILVVSVPSNIAMHRSQRDTIYRLKSELNDLDSDKRDKMAALNACDQALYRHKRESNSLRVALQSAQRIVDELQDALENDAVEEGRLEALKTQLIEAHEEVGTCEASFEDSVLEIDKIKESMGICRSRMKHLDLQIAEFKARLDKAEKTAAKASTRRQTALHDKNEVIMNEEVDESRKATLEQEHQAKVGVVVAFIEEASKICARVPVEAGQTCTSLDKKLLKLNADLRKYEERLVNHHRLLVNGLLIDMKDRR